MPPQITYHAGTNPCMLFVLCMNSRLCPLRESFDFEYGHHVMSHYIMAWRHSLVAVSASVWEAFRRRGERLNPQLIRFMVQMKENFNVSLRQAGYVL